MDKKKKLRIVCVCLLAALLIFMSLDILLPRRNDGSTGHAAIMFVHAGRLFPQMDYQQFFSDLDITSYYVIEDSVSREKMKEKVEKISKKNRSVLLLCEGDYALSGLSVAAENSSVSDLILIAPKLDDSAELGEFGAGAPSCRVAIFSTSSKTSDNLYERLSGEDTRFTRGAKADSGAPELYLSAEASRYYAKKGSWKDDQIASASVLNSPVMQTYLANYIKNYTLGEKGISRAPLHTWIVKSVCTILLIATFFLYASTLPMGKKVVPAGELKEKKGRSIADKYRSRYNHLIALQIFLGLLFVIPSGIFVIRKSDSFRIILLVWICVSILTSAFFMLPFIRKIKGRKVRSSRRMWLLHTGFTALLIADIFMLTLLWKGAGFLKPDILLAVALLLSVMLGVAMTMLQLTDAFFGNLTEEPHLILDSVKFSAIRFVPMVIVFVFSIIMRRELCAVQVLLLIASLAGASFIRRMIRRGAFGETLSVVLFSCLYWMLF